MFGLQSLSDKINAAITAPTSGGASSSADLAQQLWNGNGTDGGIFGWIKGSAYSMIITILVFIVVIFVFYGAFLYLTAYGDENRATMAKKTLTYAFVGLAIALLGLGIASYVRGILVKKTINNTTNMQVQPNQSNGDVPNTVY
jgi:uncharacterized membrane protein